MNGDLEAVFVVDGSPDRSAEFLTEQLPSLSFPSQLLVLSRNFGSFAAITAGLAEARGPLFGVMAADLQEPPDLMMQFRQALDSDRYDVAVGTRSGRRDPALQRLPAAVFWNLYRRFVQAEMPTGGIDVFACNQRFRDCLLSLPERNTSLVGLIFWLGFRRTEVPYERRPRAQGRSAWTLARRLRYLLDSSFAFSDLPVRLLSLVGLAGMILAVVLGAVVLYAKLRNQIPIPGYTATVLVVMFFGGLNSLGLGVLGEYVWRTFENTKRRPAYLVAHRRQFDTLPAS